MNRGTPSDRAALDAARDAVASSRKLAEERPDAVLPDLARDLNRLGVLLHQQGDREAGLEAVREAVSIGRTLAKRPAQAKSEKWKADHLLAKLLANLALLLDADRHARGAALEAMREAVGIYCALARISPSLHVRYLAQCFHFLRCRLSDVGPSEEAVEAAREEVDRYRSLAEWLPSVFARDFRGSVQNLRGQLVAVGRNPDGDPGLEAAERAASALDPLSTHRS
jgi:hypothetical protein